MKYIYLHGFGSGPTSAKAQYLRRELAQKGVELELPDLNLGDFRQITLSRQLEFLTNTYQNQELNLVGSSLGGYLATLWAAQTDLVRSLVLLAPALEFGKHFPAYLGAEAIATWQRDGVYPFHDYVQQQKVGLHYQFLVDAISLQGVTPPDLPTLIFHGRQDLVVPYQLSEQFAQGRCHTQLEILETDHSMTSAIAYMSGRIQEFWGL
ncbi:MAG: YqiA/YcfP family alpha/beta fold hydrolase [Pseudanabaenaceae cyanobacterium bins.68]|nr:YqiA/YcfP family alpha/beta fold hydrolase [Pseudanabaenaceae cyanobacterium bins.68]